MEHPDSSRVIVTTIDNNGHSAFQAFDAPGVVEHDPSGNPLFKVSQLWGTADGLATVGSDINPAQVTEPWFPGPGGVRFRFFTFMPSVGGTESDSGLQDVGSDDLGGFSDAFDPERPGMHISDSVDFVHVLSGEVVMELEAGELLVKEGDIVIMRGGWHNWRNETDRPCTVASVMVGAHRA